MKNTLVPFLLAALLAVPLLHASVPAEIHYQGRLTDSSGDPVSGNLPMTVRLYDAPSGGILLYEEDLGTVAVVDGSYRFSFGAAGTCTIEGTEVLTKTNGVNQIFNGIISGTPIDGTVALSDGVYSWSQAGGSSDPNFSGSYTHATKAVQMSYLAGVPEAGRGMTVTYDFSETSEIFDTITGAEHWLELLVDGVEADTRTRLLAVPYAMKARESADAQALEPQIAAIDERLEAQIAAINERLEDAERLLAGFVKVEGGTLVTSNELNGTEVSTFYMSKQEVTWGEWQAIQNWGEANGYDWAAETYPRDYPDGCAADHPVHSVSWYDVVKWCNAKSEQEGLTPVYSYKPALSYKGRTYKTGEPDHTRIIQNLTASGYRLPLEAEWEFAARGGNLTNGYTYAGSNDPDPVGWHNDNSGGAACDLWSGNGTWPVAQKAPNELGLYDMSGNVSEWCWDQIGSHRRIRGGGWNDNALHCTVSHLTFNYPAYRTYTVGFRIARSSGN